MYVAKWAGIEDLAEAYNLVEVPLSGLIGMSKTDAVAAVQKLGFKATVNERENYEVAGGCVYAAYITGTGYKTDGGKTYATPAENEVALYVAIDKMHTDTQANTGTDASGNNAAQGSPSAPANTGSGSTQTPATPPTLEEQGYIALPDVVGLTKDEAVIAIEALGVSVQITETLGSQMKSGTVLGVRTGEYKTPGTVYAKPGDTVRVFIAK